MTTDPLPSGNPYVGPRPFEEADARDGRYYGREREARDLLALVARERLVLFYAQSGAGKSSLLRASLIPALRDLGFDILPIARVSGAAPAAADAGVANVFVYDLILSVNEGLPAEDRAPAEALAKATLAEFLGGEAAGDPDAAAGLAPTVLLVDQFEEIVTAHPERWEDRAAFFEQLADALERLPRLWVVLTLREDFVAPLEPYAELLPNRLRGRYYMQRMGQEAALEAVRRPAATYGLPFAAGVAETLVDNLRRVRVQFRAEPQLGEYVEPVQLQVVCYELWQKLHALPSAPPAGSAEQQVPLSPGEAAGGEAEGRMITEADLPLGHIDQALTHFYEDALAEVIEDPAALAARTDERRLRTWFDKELITAEGIRNAVARNEQTGRTGSLANPAVDLLARRYLVRTELRAGGAWVELVHDRFIEPIRTSNAAWFPQHLSPLQRQAVLWDEQGRSDGLLLTGDALVDAERWAQAHEVELGEDERDFLAACQAARKRTERERRQSRWIRILAAVAVVISILTIAAIMRTNAAQSTAEMAQYQAHIAQADATRAQLQVAKAQADATGVRQEAATVQAVATRVQQQAATVQAVAQAAVDEAQTALAITAANLNAALTAQAPPTAQVIPTPEATGTPGAKATMAGNQTPSTTPTSTRTATPNRTAIAQQTQLAQVRATQTALAAPVISAPKGRIVYTSNRGNPSTPLELGSELWAINLALGIDNRTRLTFSTGAEAAYSRQRDRIAFTARINEGAVDLFEIPSAGGDPRPLDEHSWSDWEASYSPDGRRVAFTSSRDNQNWEIWTMGVDGGSNPQQLTRDDPELNWSPSWSPDGKYIAYFSTRQVPAGRVEVWRMAADGSNKTRLTDGNWSERNSDSIRGWSWELSWSPDSRQIAFPSNRDGNSEIYVMDLNGKNQRNLTNSPGPDEFDPAWSRDGYWMALVRRTSDRQMIVLKRIDGGQEVELTSGSHIDRQPVWLP